MPSEWLGVHGGRSYGPVPRGSSLPGPAVTPTVTPKLADSIIRDAKKLNAQVSGFVGKWPAQIISGKAQTCQTCEIEYSRGDSACQFVVMKPQ